MSDKILKNPISHYIFQKYDILIKRLDRYHVNIMPLLPDVLWKMYRNIKYIKHPLVLVNDDIMLGYL